MAGLLVFLEDHEGELVRGSLGVLSKAAQLDDDVAAVVTGAGVEELAAQAGRYGAAKTYVADDPRLEAPLPQPRVDVLAGLVADKGFDTVLFGASVLSADVAAGLAAEELGEAGSRTDVRALADPPSRGESVRIEDDGSAAEKIVEYLTERKLI